MKKKLHILNLEDSENDTELIQATLEEEGIACDMTRVETEAEFVAALDKAGFDLLLVDYKLPSFDGMSALAISKKKCPEIPFVFVSGSIGEDMAIEALKNGATDYVLKTKLSRLAPALRRAIKEAEERIERKRADEALRQNEDKYRHLVENLGKEYLFYRHDTNGIFSYVSPSITEMLGYSQQEALFHFTRFLSGNPVNKEVVEHTALSIQGLQQSPYEAEIVHKDGSFRWLEVKEHPVHNQDGGVIAVEGIARDITEHKNTDRARQASLRFLQAVHKHMEIKPLLEEFVSEIKDYTGCDSVAIRVLSEAGDIPYHAYKGFSTKFVELESPLSVKSDQCMCINVIKGTTDPRLSFYTEGGSFYMNATTRFLATVSEEEKGKTRNVCNKEGYESVALVPFRSGGRILGLIHVADHRENMVPLKMIEQLEGAAMQLGTAFQRADAEDALRKSEARYRHLFDNMLEGFAYCKMVYIEDTPQDFVYIHVNKAFESLTGLKDVIGKKVSDVIPGIQESDPELFRRYGRVALTGKPEQFEMHVVSLNIWFSISAYSTEKEYFVAVFDNITERKQAEELLRQSEEKYRNVVERAHDGIIIVQGGIIRFANMRMAELDGSSVEQLVGSSYADHVHPSELPRLADIYRRRMAGESVPSTYETILVKKDGSSAPVELNAGIITFEGKPADLVVIRDITERKQMNEALRASEHQYRQLVDNAIVGVYRATPEGKFLYVNDAMARIFECENAEEMLSLPVGIRYKRPGDREVFLNILKEQSKVPYYELEVPTKTGKIKTIAISAVLEDGAITGMVTDITVRKHLEAQLRHAQKMEAIGTLAGGIAHDFNNILNVILGFGRMLMDRIGDDPLSKEQMNEVLDAAERAANLTKRLLVFSRKQEVEVKPVNINETILGLQKMIARIIRESIDIKLDLTERPLMVMADAGQLEQVLMNLAANARDAMPEVGRLTFSTGIQELDDEYVTAYGYGKPGRYALITVSDTGSGMDAETQKKIFEPFFTTKGIGEGTGLGLAISYEIIKQHGGHLKVYSEPAQGTVFKIYLPLIEGPATPDKKTETAVPDKGGHETVLVAEDDAALRKLTRIVLESSGYTVITAEDGEDAITKFMENRERVHLAVIDMIMPKKSGKEVSEALREKSPHIKILFVSGYTMDKIKTSELTEAGFDFIHKPVQPKDLLRKVREILDRKA